MRIVRALCIAASLGGIVQGVAWAGPPELESKLREVEAALLHKRLDLSSVAQWRQAPAGDWRPLTVPAAKVYVVNLWSVHCQPCIAEMPLLAKIVRGWSGHPEVQFLFVADPPGDTPLDEVERFWKKPPVELPRVEPCRTTNDTLRDALEVGTQPITLLLDDKLIVRQVFAGAIGNRQLGASIERLLAAANVAEPGKKGRARR